MKETLLTEKKIRYIEYAGIGFIALACFCSLLSTTGKAIATLLFILCWLLAKGYKEYVPILGRYPMALCAFLILVLYCFAVFYSVAPFDDLWDRVKGMRGLFYPAVVIFFCERNPKGADWIINAYLTAFVVLMLITFLIFFGVVARKYGWCGVDYSLIHPSFNSGMMAFLFYIACHKIKQAGYIVRFFWGTLALLAFVVIFYVQQSLTGMVVFFALFLLLFIQTLSWQKLVVGGVFLVVSFILLTLTSSRFNDQGEELYNTLSNYEEQVSQGKFNNISLRLAWQINSLKLIAKRPFLGSGPASFPVVHGELIKGTLVPPRKGPHNAFLLVGVETGLVGMVLLFSAIFFAAKRSFTLQEKYRFMLQGVLVLFVVGSFCDNWFCGNYTGYLFTVLVPALLATEDDAQTIHRPRT